MRESIYYGEVEITDLRTVEALTLRGVIFKPSTTIRDLIPHLRRIGRKAEPAHYQIKRLRTDTAKVIGVSNL